MRLTKRRLSLLVGGLGAVGAASVLSLGATSAVYTSSAPTQNNTITSGTVTLTQNVPQSHAFNLAGFMPGDHPSPSVYMLNYAGSDAFVGLDMTITSTAANPCAAYSGGAASIASAAVLTNCTGVGTVPMFDGNAGSGSLDLSVTPENGQTAHQLFDDAALEGAATCSAAVGGVVTCTVTKSNVLLPPAAGTEMKWGNGQADWVYVDVSLPLIAGNIFQGSTVGIDMTAHAVQWANNHSTQGAGCATGTTFPQNLVGVVATTCPAALWS